MSSALKFVASFVVRLGYLSEKIDDIPQDESCKQEFFKALRKYHVEICVTTNAVTQEKEIGKNLLLVWCILDA